MQGENVPSRTIVMKLEMENWVFYNNYNPGLISQVSTRQKSWLSLLLRNITPSGGAGKMFVVLAALAANANPGPIKMNLLKTVNITKITYTLFGIVFLISGLLINLVQVLLYIFIRPFNELIFRKCNYYLSYSIYSQIIFLQQYWADIRVTLHAKKYDFDNHFGKESALLIMNHSYEIDWMIGWILCEYCGILGNVKTFAKKSLQYVPIVGYSWKIGGSIFVERNWQKDQEMFEAKLRDLVTYKDPIWLLLAAEGTRFTKEKHEASKAFAREHGLPELRHHLTPRTKGFTTSLPILRDKITAIYNINVGIMPGGVRPTLTNILLGKSINADFFVERILTKDLPKSEAELASWLHSLYKRKDDLIDSYLTTGKWNASPDATPYETFLLPRRIFAALNFACWFVCILAPLGYLIIKLVMLGSLLSVATVGGIIGSFIYLLDKLVGETKISKASSYGIAKDIDESKKN